MSNKNDNGINREREGYYSSLTGFKRAVPIILAAIAIFTAVCFIAGDTGLLGKGIALGLRGLFSYGAYVIPVLVGVHAIFFAEDCAKSRLVSRIIFSLIAVILISSVEYTVTFWTSEYVFDPLCFFEERAHGGLIGSTVGFALVKALGKLGLTIFAVAVIAIYVAFFFSSGSRAIKGTFSKLKSLVTGGADRVVSGAKEARVKAREAHVKAKEAKIKATKNEHARLSKEDERKSAALLDDSFFAVDNGMSELKITELGIHEERDDISSEVNPTLQREVFHKSAVKEEPVRASAPESGPAEEARPRRRVHTSFGSYGLRDEAERDTRGDIIYDSTMSTHTEADFGTARGDDAYARSASSSAPRTSRSVSGIGLDESADDLFNSGFDPYSSALNERAAKYASTRSTVASGIAGYEEPVELPTEAELAEMRRKADIQRAADIRKEAFERSKLEARARYEREQAAIRTERSEIISTAEPSVPTSVAEPVYSASRVSAVSTAAAEPVRPAEPIYSEPKTAFEEVTEHGTKTVAFNVERETTVVRTPADGGAVKFTFEKPERTADNVEDAAAAIAAAVARSNPAYARSANESILTHVTAQTPTQSVTESPTNVYDESAEKQTEEIFRPYVAPTTEPITTPAPAEVLRTERTMLSPTHSTESITSGVEIEWETDESIEELPASATESTTFSFDDIAEDEEEITAESLKGAEEENEEPREIPPELQNPDVIRQRAMFPFLDEVQPASTPAEEPASAPIVVTDEPEATYDEPTSTVEELPLPEEIVTEPDPEPEKPKKPDFSEYTFPPLDLLGLDSTAVDENAQAEIQENADKLIDTLASFNVTASIKGVDRGPRITRYEVVPAKGVKVSSIMNLQDDIAMNLEASSIRMEAPIPGKSAVGVEIPNKKSSTVRLRELIDTEDFRSLKSKTSVCMGKDVAGQPVFADIGKMPHALIAGATGMGKSVCINSLIISMLYKARPDEVKFIMIDPKQVEFTMYNGIPHLLVPIVTDVHQAAGTLMWAVEEMERRYTLLQKACARNIDGYNEKVAKNPEMGEPMHRIVIVIDEFAELIMQVKNPVEQLVIRIAQKARAAGIHLIIGTQKPVKEVITGLIKSNIPSKFSCKVASNRDSILIFDQAGAEKLLDKGDMLVAFANSLQPTRVQCAFVADEEVEAVMDYLKENNAGVDYDESVMEDIRRAADRCQNRGGGGDEDDDGERESGEGYLNDRQFLDAVDVAISARKISTSLIQRRISIGYGKAAKFIDIMEDMGIVGPPNGQRPREVLLTEDEWREKLSRSMID